MYQSGTEKAHKYISQPLGNHKTSINNTDVLQLLLLFYYQWLDIKLKNIKKK